MSLTSGRSAFGETGPSIKDNELKMFEGKYVGLLHSPHRHIRRRTRSFELQLKILGIFCQPFSKGISNCDEELVLAWNLLLPTHLKPGYIFD